MVKSIIVLVYDTIYNCANDNLVDHVPDKSNSLVHWTLKIAAI